METVKLGKAKAELSRLVSRARRGERVRITVRGIPVAEIVPLAPGSAHGDEAALLRLEQAGIVVHGRGGIPKEIFKPGPRPRGQQPTSTVLLDERRRRP